MQLELPEVRVFVLWREQQQQHCPSYQGQEQYGQRQVQLRQLTSVPVLELETGAVTDVERIEGHRHDEVLPHHPPTHLLYLWPVDLEEAPKEVDDSSQQQHCRRCPGCVAAVAEELSGVADGPDPFRELCVIEFHEGVDAVDSLQRKHWPQQRLNFVDGGESEEKGLPESE